MRIRKIVWCIAIFLLIVFQIGCKARYNDKKHNGVAVENGLQNQEDVEDKIRLRFCWWGNEDRHLSTLSALNLYMEEHPNVEIKCEYMGWDGYYEKLIAQMISGTTPDIMQIDPSWMMNCWQMKEKFVNFRDQSVIDMSLFQAYDEMLNMYSAKDGYLIGLPTGINFTTLYVNGDLAEEIGLDLSVPFSWEKVLSDGKKVQEYDSEMYLLSSNEIGAVFFFFDTYLQNRIGNYIINDDFSLGFTYEDVYETFCFLKMLYDQKIISPYNEMITLQNIWEGSSLQKGKVVAVQQMSSNNMSAKAAFPNCVYCVPVGNPNAQNTGYILRPTNFYSVSATSKNQQEALEIVNFLYTDERAIDLLGLCRSLPVTDTAWKRMKEQKRIPEGLEEVFLFIKDHKGEANSNLASMRSEFMAIEYDEFSKLYYGELSPEEAALEFMERMQRKADDLKRRMEKNFRS